MSTDKKKPVVTQKVGWAAMAAVLLPGVIAAQSVPDQAPGSVTVDVGHCIEIESEAERRDCFGAEVNAVIRAQSDDRSGETKELETDRDAATVDANIENADTHEEAAAAGSRRTRRGADERALDEPEKSEAADPEYSGTITAMRERAPNRYAIALDNGQIWEQVVPEWYPLRPGLEVRVYPSHWGKSYRLSGVGTSGYIQVRRVQ